MTTLWQQQVIAYLATCKRDAIPSQEAWAKAMIACPPRARGVDPARLFDEAKPDYLLAFFKRVALAAYDDTQGLPGSGQGPAIRHFQVGMLRDLDSSGPARRVRRAA